MTALAAALGARLTEEQVSTGESVLRLHGEDLSFHPACLPDVVVHARSTADVAATLSVAADRRVPVVPFGAGSSLEGHVLPVHGGISLDLTGMDRILALRPEELTVTAQAGVRRLALADRLGEHGLFLPVDPGADATLGGMAATNAAGTMTFRHGKMRARVLALEAVLPGGRVVRTGSRAVKTSAGYDLTGLLIGSEGTLAVITELTLRVEGIPEATAATRASFDRVEDAVAVVATVVAAGIDARRLELVDEWEVAALNRFMGAGLPDASLLLVETAGPAAAAAMSEVRGLLEAHGGRDVRIASDAAGQQALWKLRRDVFEAERMVAPGRRSVSTDACVPLGELAGTIVRTRRELDRLGLLGGIISHAGDGNVHTGVLVDPGDGEEMRRLDAFLDAVVTDALARGGTCTGEHGIGMGKRDALAREHGDQLDLMAGIKRLFDPLGIMNPGKVLPDPVAAAMPSG